MPSDFIVPALRTSLFLLLFALGLESGWQHLVGAFGRGGRARCLLGINLIAPLLAVALSIWASLDAAVTMALVVLSLTGIPQVLPRTQLSLGGAREPVAGTLVAAALASVASIPAVVEVLSLTVGADQGIAPAHLARLVTSTVGIPLAAGMAVRLLDEQFADRAARWVASGSRGLTVVGLLLIAASDHRFAATLIWDGTLAIAATVSAAGLVLGHVLGGPEPSARAAFALTGAARHPGLAALVLSQTFPEDGRARFSLVAIVAVSSALTLCYFVFFRLRRGRATLQPV